MQLKTFLPFLTISNYEYISSLNRSLSQFKTLNPNFSDLKSRRKNEKPRTLNRMKILTTLYPQFTPHNKLNVTGVKKFPNPQNFYILKPIIGGFKAYTANTLGFLPQVQMKKICRS